jgi:hypothetical protein
MAFLLSCALKNQFFERVTRRRKLKAMLAVH